MVAALTLGGCQRPRVPRDAGRESRDEMRPAGGRAAGVQAAGGRGRSHATAIDEQPVPWVPADPSVHLALERFRSGSEGDRMAVAGLLMKMGSEEAMTGLVLLLRELPPGDVKSTICQRLETIDVAGKQEFLLGL